MHDRPILQSYTAVASIPRLSGESGDSCSCEHALGDIKLRSSCRLDTLARNPCALVCASLVVDGLVRTRSTLWKFGSSRVLNGSAVHDEAVVL